MMDGIIVDLDGTLFFTEKRWQKCQEEVKNKREFWECYQSAKYMPFDEVNKKVADFVREMAKKTAIIIISGRLQETQIQYTLYQLTANNIPFNVIIMRRKGDYRKDAVFKIESAKQLMKSYNIVLVIDDSKDVRDEFQKLGIRAISPDEI